MDHFNWVGAAQTTGHQTEEDTQNEIWKTNQTTTKNVNVLNFSCLVTRRQTNTHVRDLPLSFFLFTADDVRRKRQVSEWFKWMRLRLLFPRLVVGVRPFPYQTKAIDAFIFLSFFFFFKPFFHSSLHSRKMCLIGKVYYDDILKSNRRRKIIINWPNSSYTRISFYSC